MSSSEGEGRRIFRVGISGSYGGFNLGDEAILHVIVAQLRRSLPVEITVFSRDPADTLRRHPVDRAIPVRDLARNEVLPEVARLDLFILGGGGILFDAEATVYMREVALAEASGVPVLVYAISAGPLRERRAREVVREGINRAAAITVRERQAQRLLEEIGVTRKITVTSDPALLLEPEPLPPDALLRENLDSEERLVGFSVREPGPAAPDLDIDHYHALVADTADYIVERFDASVVFVPMERRMLDVQHAHAVVARMTQAKHASVLRGVYTQGQMLTLVGRFEFAVGMRLHFLIFAALQRVPFVALPYADKVTGFLNDLGLPAPPVYAMRPGPLLAHIDRSWDLRQDLRGRIDRVLPGLQGRARETNRIAVRMLTRGLHTDDE